MCAPSIVNRGVAGTGALDPAPVGEVDSNEYSVVGSFARSRTECADVERPSRAQTTQTLRCVNLRTQKNGLPMRVERP